MLFSASVGLQLHRFRICRRASSAWWATLHLHLCLLDLRPHRDWFLKLPKYFRFLVQTCQAQLLSPFPPTICSACWIWQIVCCVVRVPSAFRCHARAPAEASVATSHCEYAQPDATVRDVAALTKARSRPLWPQARQWLSCALKSHQHQGCCIFIHVLASCAPLKTWSKKNKKIYVYIIW